MANIAGYYLIKRLDDGSLRLIRRRRPLPDDGFAGAQRGEEAATAQSRKPKLKRVPLTLQSQVRMQIEEDQVKVRERLAKLDSCEQINPQVKAMQRSW